MKSLKTTVLIWIDLILGALLIVVAVSELRMVWTTDYLYVKLTQSDFFGSGMLLATIALILIIDGLVIKGIMKRQG